MEKLFSTGDAKVLLPGSILDGMVKATRSTSTVAQLSGREPMKFGEHDIPVFNDFPKMEFVDEGAPKSATTAGFTSVRVVPHKGQVTLRFSEEVLWADKDYQLGVLQEVATEGAVALSRGLDLGLYHRINPLTGTALTWDNYIGASSKVVTRATADADADFRAAVGLLVNSQPSVQVNGAAFDPKFSWALSELKDKDGRERYPALGFGTDISDFKGVRVAQGDTVSGTPEATDTKVRAIVGDFANGIRWGIQRRLPVQIIEYGNPDGQGDLKHHNQIALRLEIVYAWYAFVDRFALVKDGAGMP